MMERELKQVFTASGYEDSSARVVLSSRPDLCEYQCNGVIAVTKVYKERPIGITNQVAEHLVSGGSHPVSSGAETVIPGFINLKLLEAFLAEYTSFMVQSDKLELKTPEKPETVIMDYGGTNVAKPFHVGHLRVVITGESIKRMGRFLGYHMIGGIYLRDWGLQIDPIIEELRDRKPELVYLDKPFEGSFPQEAPFTISELEKIYPVANAKSKADEVFKGRVHQATLKLQRGYVPCRTIRQHIMAVSVVDLKEDYANLNVEFNLREGGNDTEPYTGDMIQMLVDKGLVHESQGALVVDVAQDTDTKEIPPCLARKSDGASLYAASGLATIAERERDFKLDRCVYVMDKRQGMHLEQVFRITKKADTVKEDTPMIFLGLSTMNGKGGKPLKTREGGATRLEKLIEEISEAAYQRVTENKTVSEDEARNTATVVGLAALRYDDLSNQAAKDYIFDIERFTSFEGNTGPHILYTIVGVKSIITKHRENGGQVSQDAVEEKILAYAGSSEKAPMFMLVRYNEVLGNSFAEAASHETCQYIHELANVSNSLYHDIRILAEEGETRKESCIGLTFLTRRVLEVYTGLLGIETPERM